MVSKRNCSPNINQYQIGSWCLAVLLITGIGLPSSAAATRRALLIGINKYSPCEVGSRDLTSLPSARKHCSDWHDLDGAVNDVKGMQAVIEIRFGFKPENVHLLIDDQATRQAILDGIQRYLIQEAEPGDVVFLYYAGHGSQVRNSFSYERDKMDQTIVPVDANRGVHDIRDKALARLFNQMLDKHLTVTAIFDSCHSGAIARGFIVPARGRYLPAIDDRDAKDPFRGPFPENRGALIVSAAQANEQALETETEPVHGLFTGALLRVLSIVPVNTPVSEIFKIVEAQVATDDPYESLGYGIENAQIPNWAGKDRGANSLFSIRSEQAAREFTVPALSPDIQRGVVSLEGGLSIGLAPGSELTRVGGQTNAPEIRLEVVDSSAAQSLASVVQGDVTIVHVGDLFEVV